MPLFRPTLPLLTALLATPVCLPAAAQAVRGEAPADEAGMPSLPLELGGAGRATVLSPDMRTTAAVVEEANFRFLIPGCAPVENGAYLCSSVEEFQHCRTLMSSRMIESCRVGVAFAGGFAEPRAAEPGSFSVEVDSKARIRVERGNRNFGQTRGEARVVVSFDEPADFGSGWCAQREPFVYFPTGPKGGTTELGEPAPCGEPLEFTFEPHADDALRAYDLCEAFGLWGEGLEDSIEVLAASLFHLRSASPEFMARYPGGSAIVAPYATVTAPVAVDCRD